MPNWLWMLLLVVVLVIVAHHVQERLVQVLFYVLALVLAVLSVLRVTGHF